MLLGNVGFDMEMASNDLFFGGTSGLILPVRNKSFYPADFQQSSRLTFYGSLQNSIEINSSFYKIPMPSTVRKWASEVPENFKFTFKVWRNITHIKELAYRSEDLYAFLDAINAVGHKNGCILMQFPASIRFAHYKQLDRLLRDIVTYQKGLDWHIAVEFRHSSCFEPELCDLIDALDLSLVMHDKGLVTDLEKVADSDFVYLRFHGPDGNYRGTYDDALLYEYAGYVKDWLLLGKRVYVYFNNTMGGAWNNLETLKKYITT